MRVTYDAAALQLPPLRAGGDPAKLTEIARTLLRSKEHEAIAVAALRRAAELGQWEANLLYGKILHEGERGTTKDPAGAVENLQRALNAWPATESEELKREARALMWSGTSLHRSISRSISIRFHALQQALGWIDELLPRQVCSGT